MLFDVGEIAERLEKFSPRLSRTVGMKVLGFISPFNSHLKAGMSEWTQQKVVLTMKCHRNVKNHVGGIHAGALFTIGESCAGLIIVRNFSFKKYRPLMTQISAEFSKQARNSVKAVAKISSEGLKKARSQLKTGKAALLPMETQIFNTKNELVAIVKTKWQVKPWDQVKTK